MKTQNALTVRPEPLPAVGRAALNHRALADAWAADLQARARAGMIADRTADAYARNVGRWLSWLDACALERPTPAAVLAYVADLRADGLKPASVNAHLDAVRGLLDFADGESLQALRNRALVHVLFSTGLRLVSLCAANVADLDTADAVLAYCGKGDRDAARRAYLSRSALDAVNRYLAARADAEGADLDKAAPLFAAVGNRAGGDRLTARSVRRVVVDLMEKAGHVHRDAAGKIERPRVLSAHSLRRSAITCAFDAAGLDAAQTLAGHADPKTTRRAYARVQKGRVLRNLAGVLDLGTVDAGKVNA